MRSMVIVVLGIGFIACKEHGKGGPNDGPTTTDDGGNQILVDDLTTNSQVALCNEFVTQLCANSTDPNVDGFCADACINNPQSCVDASEQLNIDSECAGVPVSAVEDCFTTGDLDICQAQGGGCMFDALDAICAPV